MTMDELMALLVAKVGLPPADVTDDPGAALPDVGLDSLAYLQLQAEIKALYGVDLPDDRPLTMTFGEMLRAIAPSSEGAVA
jgi:minimal PKS acyl carrier protein